MPGINPPTTSLKERIAALEHKTSPQGTPHSSNNGSSKTTQTAPIGGLKDKIANFEKKGGTPIPRGSFGLGAPLLQENLGSRRRGELYGNRIPSAQKSSTLLDVQTPGSPRRLRCVSVSGLGLREDRKNVDDRPRKVVDEDVFKTLDPPRPESASSTTTTTPEDAMDPVNDVSTEADQMMNSSHSHAARSQSPVLNMPPPPSSISVPLVEFGDLAVDEPTIQEVAISEPGISLPTSPVDSETRSDDDFASAIPDDQVVVLPPPSSGDDQLTEPDVPRDAFDSSDGSAPTSPPLPDELPTAQHRPASPVWTLQGPQAELDATPRKPSSSHRPPALSAQSIVSDIRPSAPVPSPGTPLEHLLENTVYLEKTLANVPLSPHLSEPTEKQKRTPSQWVPDDISEEETGGGRNGPGYRPGTTIQHRKSIRSKHYMPGTLHGHKHSHGRSSISSDDSSVIATPSPPRNRGTAQVHDADNLSIPKNDSSHPPALDTQDKSQSRPLSTLTTSSMGSTSSDGQYSASFDTHIFDSFPSVPSSLPNKVRALKHATSVQQLAEQKPLPALPSISARPQAASYLSRAATLPSRVKKTSSSSIPAWYDDDDDDEGTGGWANVIVSRTSY